MSSTLRFQVVGEAFTKKAIEVPNRKERPSEYFAKYVFNRQKMFKYLPSKVFNKMCDVMDNGSTLDMATANAVAEGMKKWAMELGATHCTHWFQPLTEGTAEKHDGFVEHDWKGGMIEEFTGKELVQQEPDASSFPSGGIRSTFEARGYSAWDPASPVFVIGDTLMIPTVFISYTGEALDYKAPLKKALKAVDKAATEVAHYFYPDVKKVVSNLGWEQEYFLVDEGLYAARPDLLMTGRTLMGHDSAKNQQMDDHYFGSIPERVAAFMKDLEIKALELGIPCKTRHNEVAPNQFELAPIFEETNLAVDHNMLIMSLMKRVARKHGFRCLLHEKPFAGINGSGKHNNWSLTTDGGRNLLAPGKQPQHNDMFLLMLAAVMKAVDEHAGLLRMSASNPGNDHRLGGHEAPPAVISMFLGDQLTAIVGHIIEGNEQSVPSVSNMKVGVSTLPVIRRDAGDRNRTSPFAFTGNKFEFRMPPSSGCIADANTVLNTIVADALSQFADELEKAENFEEALHALIRRELAAHQRIIFNGNGYTDEWLAEAKRRGLPNIRSMVDAIPELVAPDAVALFERHGVYTEKELRARADVSYELYAKTINIEALTMIDMAGKDILPAVVRYTKQLADTVIAVEAAGGDAGVQRELLGRVSVLLRQANSALSDLREKQAHAASLTGEAQARAYYEEVTTAMQLLRAPVDHLEMVTDGALWPIPTYGELLFNV